MTLTLFDASHQKISALKNYNDLYVEQATGNSTTPIIIDKLHFKYPIDDENNKLIDCECYISTGTDEYVVKEKNPQSGDGVKYCEYICDLNIEPLSGNVLETFTPGNTTADVAANLALAGTGWEVNTCEITKKRTSEKTQCTVLDALSDIAKAFNCEIDFDTINKKINLHTKEGANRGSYFAEQINLKQLTYQKNSRNYITRLYPIGKDGLTIASVNSNVKFVSNYQYSTKVISAYWVDNRYTIAADLKADAEDRLDYLSKPEIAYSAEIIDLAKVDSKWSLLDFKLGDYITLISKSNGTHEKQRIVKIKRYLVEPEKTTVELANRIASLSDIILRVSDAADTVSDITDSTGSVQGSNVKVSGTDGNYTSLNAAIANIGQIVATKATITDLTAAVGRITTLESESVTTDYLTANYITADAITSNYATIDNLNAATGRIDSLETNSITAEYLSAHCADIDLANVKTGSVKQAMIDTGAVGTAQIADGSITNAKIVDLTANKITAGTLSVERLIITGNDKSIVYAINSANGTTQLSQTTLDGGSLTQRSITADRIVAGAITANEIATNTITANSGIIADAAISNAKIASIDASKITTGTLNANRINVTDLINAINVSTENIYAQKINASNGYYTKISDIDTFDSPIYGLSTYNAADEVTSFIGEGIISGNGTLKLFPNAFISHPLVGTHIDLDSDEIYLSSEQVCLTTPLATISGQLDLTGVTYPQIYGNGKVLQMSYCKDSGAGAIIEYGSFRPAGSGWGLGTANHRWGQIYSTNAAISTSDRNMKNTIVALDKEFSTNFIMSLIPSSFKLNDGTSGRTHYGMIAQDIETEIEELGLTSLDFAGFIKSPQEDGSYIYGLRYEEFIAPLIATVQAQNERIKSLENKIATLEAA